MPHKHSSKGINRDKTNSDIHPQLRSEINNSLHTLTETPEHIRGIIFDLMRKGISYSKTGGIFGNLREEVGNILDTFQLSIDPITKEEIVKHISLQQVLKSPGILYRTINFERGYSQNRSSFTKLWSVQYSDAITLQYLGMAFKGYLSESDVSVIDMFALPRSEKRPLSLLGLTEETINTIIRNQLELRYSPTAIESALHLLAKIEEK